MSTSTSKQAATQGDDPLRPWKQWAEGRFGQSGPTAVAVATTALEEALLGHRSDRETAVKAAETAVREFLTATAVVTTNTARNGALISQTTEPSAETYGGISDLAAADLSPHGRQALHALDQAQGSSTLATAAFFGQPGFRGRYGFHDAAGMTGIGSLILWVVGAVAFPIGIPVALWVGLITPALARRSSVEVERGRLVLRYGLLARRMETFELIWFANVSYRQSLLQRWLGQTSVFIVMDGGPFRGTTLCIPGIIEAEAAEGFCDRIRHAAQLLRRGAYGVPLPPN
jgi:hypothetical protein